MQVLLILYCLTFIDLGWSEQFIEVPKSQVIFTGTKTSLNCTVESDGYTKWTLSRKSGELTISHDDSVMQNLNHYFRIRKVSHMASKISYNLEILNVTMNLSGVYTCHLTKSKAMASISVMNTTVCNNRVLGYDVIFSCSYEFSGLYNFTPNWNPKEQLHLTRTSYNTIKYSNYEIIQCNTTTQMKKTELVECNCTVSTGKLLYFHSSFGITSEVNPPIFNKLLAPISKIHVNVTNGNKLYNSAFMACLAESNLAVNYEMEIRSTNYRNILHRNTRNSIRIPSSSTTFSLTCYASNGLNPSKVRKVVDSLEISTTQIYCRNTAWNCVRQFYNIIFNKKLPQEDEQGHKEFCIKTRPALYCLFKNSKCKNEEKTFLLANILIAYCVGEFGKLRYMAISLEERFPHTMAQKYLHHQSSHNSTALPVIDRELYEGYCTRLEFSAYTVAEVGFSLAVGKHDAKKWLQSFFEASVGAKMENYDVIYVKERGHIKRSRTLENCNAHDGFNFTTCGLFSKCITVHVEMLNLYHYGYTFIKDKNKLLSIVCDLKEEHFRKCHEKFLKKCDPYIQALTYPFIRMRRFLCDIKHMKLFFEYNEKCYNRLEMTIQTSLSTYDNTPLFHCASLYRSEMEDLLFDSRNVQSKKEMTCTYTKLFLDCLEKKIYGVCKDIHAAKIQRSLARMAVYHGLGDVECRKSFLHYDMELFSSADQPSPHYIYLAISTILCSL